MAAASAIHLAQNRVVAGSGPNGHRAQMRWSSSDALRSVFTPELLYIGRVAGRHKVVGRQLAAEGALEQAAPRAVTSHKGECQSTLLSPPDHRVAALGMVSTARIGLPVVGMPPVK